MNFTSRPTLFSAAVDLVPRLTDKPLAQASDEEIRILAKRVVQIARMIGDELSEGPWGPTIAPMPTLANEAKLVPDAPNGTRPEWIRLPKSGRCPFTGLSRSKLYDLVGDTEANGHRPPVKSVVVRKRGAMRGVRLISYDSLMAYLASIGAHGDETEE